MLGVVLAIGPIVGGLFSKVASGKQMIDQFAPHMEADARARYGTDLQTLRAAAVAVDTIYAQQAVAPGGSRASISTAAKRAQSTSARRRCSSG